MTWPEKTRRSASIGRRGLGVGVTVAVTISPLAGQTVDGRVASAPFTVEGAYTADALGTVRGGLKQSIIALDNLDLKLRMDGETLFGIPGASSLVYVISNRGDDPGQLVGDAQGISSIAAPRAWRLYEAWIQQNLAGGRLSVLAGLYDVNTEFDAIQASGLFLNSSFGMGPDYSQSGLNGPSVFPSTSLGVRLKFRPSAPFYVAMAVLDGVPGDPASPTASAVRLSRRDGALLAFEAAVFEGAGEEPALTRRVNSRNRHRRIGRGQSFARYHAKVALGAWTYTTQLPVPGAPPGTSAVSFGVYALTERALFREPQAPNGLSWFARSGIARSSVNRFGGYVGTGLTYAGPFRGRGDDEVGVGVAIAMNGSEYRDVQRTAGINSGWAETAIELTYRWQAHPALAVQPDIQWILAPNTDPSQRNALVIGVRGEAAFRVRP